MVSILFECKKQKVKDIVIFSHFSMSYLCQDFTKLGSILRTNFLRQGNIFKQTLPQIFCHLQRHNFNLMKAFVNFAWADKGVFAPCVQMPRIQVTCPPIDTNRNFKYKIVLIATIEYLSKQAMKDRSSDSKGIY